VAALTRDRRASLQGAGEGKTPPLRGDLSGLEALAEGVEPTGTVVVLEASSTTDEDHASVTIPVANMMVKQGYTVDVLYYSDEMIEKVFSVCYNTKACVCLIPEADRSKTLNGMITQIGAMGVKSGESAEAVIALLQETLEV